MAEAYVTLATNDTYALGALVLAHSLKSAQTSKQLCILITPDVSLEVRGQLADLYNNVVIVNVLDSQDAAHLALMKRPELGVTLTKLHCWSLIQYTKCVFLDADILAIQNADELFEQPELSAACDVGWPDCFNSGMFVFTPSMETYSKLLLHAEESGSFDGGDQGLLNAFFPNWNRVSFIYNMVSSATYTYLPAYKQYGQDVKFIHFLGSVKPWHQRYHRESGTVDPKTGQEHVSDHLNTWWRICTTYVQPDMSPEPTPECHASNNTTNVPPDVSMQVHELETYINLPPSPTPQLDVNSLPSSSISFPNDTTTTTSTFELPPEPTETTVPVFPPENVDAPQESACVVVTSESRDTSPVDPVQLDNQVCIEPPEPVVTTEQVHSTAHPVYSRPPDDPYDQFVVHDRLSTSARTTEPVFVPPGMFTPFLNTRMPSPYSVVRKVADPSQSAVDASELSERMIGLDLATDDVRESQQRWESGLPDYLGRDSFDNILAHIDAQLQSPN